MHFMRHHLPVVNSSISLQARLIPRLIVEFLRSALAFSGRARLALPPRRSRSSLTNSILRDRLSIFGRASLALRSIFEIAHHAGLAPRSLLRILRDRASIFGRASLASLFNFRDSASRRSQLRRARLAILCDEAFMIQVAREESEHIPSSHLS